MEDTKRKKKLEGLTKINTSSEDMSDCSSSSRTTVSTDTRENIFCNNSKDLPLGQDETLSNGINVSKVNQAISNLESLKQQIIELHFGIKPSGIKPSGVKPSGVRSEDFDSGLPLTYQEIASLLSKTSSPELVLQFASSHRDNDDKIEFSIEDIKFLEEQALRELARPSRRK